MTEVHALLLAAGGSRRLGRAKQLLDWRGRTLIEHQIDTLRRSSIPITVILGASAELIEPIIAETGVSIIRNRNWELGMGTSISLAVETLRFQKRSFDGILITLVDQPLIESSHFNRMLNKFKPGLEQIICSRSDRGHNSPPTLFDTTYCDELIALTGDSGAKRIIENNRQKIEMIRCETSLEDIDTIETYHKLIKLANRRS